jgi:hypothetical protein
VGMGEGEMMVVTWKRFEGADEEQRVRPSPGAFLRICRRRGGETRDGVSSSACSPSEGGGRFVYDRRKRTERKEFKSVRRGKERSRLTRFD